MYTGYWQGNILENHDLVDRAEDEYDNTEVDITETVREDEKWMELARFALQCLHVLLPKIRLV